jgi:hypothetical protein
MKNIYEIFEEYEKATKRQDRLNILRFNDSQALRNILQGTFDPRVQFVFESIPEYKASDSPPGLGYTSIHTEMSRAYLFEKNNPRVAPNLSLERRKQILIQMLEAMEEKEAKVFANMLMKKQEVKGLTAEIVKEAFPGLLA